MADRVRRYLFYDVAMSICPTCFRKLEGKMERSLLEEMS